MVDIALLKSIVKNRVFTIHSAYILRVKVDAAMELLLHTDMTCSEISYAVGFTRPEIAMRAFKRLKGTTMMAYRRSLKKQLHDALCLVIPQKSTNFR